MRKGDCKLDAENGLLYITMKFVRSLEVRYDGLDHNETFNVSLDMCIQYCFWPSIQRQVKPRREDGCRRLNEIEL